MLEHLAGVLPRGRGDRLAPQHTRDFLDAVALRERVDARQRAPAGHVLAHREVVVGERLAQRFPELQLGSTVTFGRIDFRVVGLLGAEGGSFASEVWGATQDFGNAFQRQNYCSSSLLRTASDQVAWLHVSWTEWKNMFSLEIYGHDAKLHIEGLGGSYGVERLAYYRMLPEMGPPETTIWEYPRGDQSWEIEMAEFLDDIRLGRTPAASLEDALAALRIVEKIYEVSQT